MRVLYFSIVTLILCAQPLLSQVDSVQFNRIQEYKDWGWEALVLENNHVTAAFVPSMGGSMMQYDFGIDTFLMLNPETFGIDYDPYLNQNPFQGSWGFGGCQIWTTPEAWPPPAVLTWGNYDDTVFFDTPDSIKVMLRSELEITPITDIQFEKSITMRSHSTGIEITTAYYNFQTTPLEAGIMIAAEVTTQHEERDDHENFSIYFPLNSESRFGETGVYISPSSPAFIGEIIPGVFCVEYANRTGKVYADSPSGWIAYVDERDKQTYVCLFDPSPEEDYPNPGAWTEVYVEGQVPFMALEVLSPLNNIAADGGSFSFTHYFYSTRLGHPIVGANHAGAVSEHLRYDSLNQVITGTFGFFNEGQARLLFRDSLDNILMEGNLFNVHPDTILFLSESCILPEETRFIELDVYDYNGEEISILDYKDLMEPQLVSLPEISSTNTKFNLITNILTNNDELSYELFIERNTNYSIELYDQMGGRREIIAKGIKSPGYYQERAVLKKYTPGRYYVIYRSNDLITNEVLVLL